MFTIGLEFSKDKIKKMIKDFFLFGGLQVLISWLVLTYLLYFYGLVLFQSLLGGFILALSSTAIVLKLLQDNDDLNSPSGLKMTSILLFQDAIIIPAILIFPFISQLGTAPPIPVIVNILIALGAVILTYLICKFIFPVIFKLILNLRIPDLLTVTVFVLLFGIAVIAHQLGVSLAMSALIVGVAISDSDYVHQINTDIIPSKYIFNSIFFISIGMFVDISFFITNFLDIALFAAVIIIVKLIIIFLLFVIFKRPLNSGILTAFGLAHVGEFSFILLKIAQDQALFPQDFHQILLSAAIISIFMIPFAMKLGQQVSGFERFKKELPDKDAPKSYINHTIIAGFGINGQNIARILKVLNIPYVIMDLNPATVRNYKSQDEPIHFGNIDRITNLKSLGIARASLLVIAINDIEAAGRAVTLARKLNPSINIIVRSNFISQVEKLYHFGADLVSSQDMETSLIFLYHILKFYRMPDHVSRIQTNLLRKEHYRFFIKEDTQESWKIAILDFIEQDNELFFVGPFSKHVSKKIGDLEPSSYDDIQIIGVIRQNKVITESLHSVILEKYDTIIFSGNHKKVYDALTWMEENN
jgi:CPA2 family monovalent cation:H+ antiporter-2